MENMSHVYRKQPENTQCDNPIHNENVDTGCIILLLDMYVWHECRVILLIGTGMQYYPIDRHRNVVCISYWSALEFSKILLVGTRMWYDPIG